MQQFWLWHQFCQLRAALAQWLPPLPPLSCVLLPVEHLQRQSEGTTTEMHTVFLCFPAVAAATAPGASRKPLWDPVWDFQERQQVIETCLYSEREVVRARLRGPFLFPVQSLYSAPEAGAWSTAGGRPGNLPSPFVWSFLLPENCSNWCCTALFTFAAECLITDQGKSVVTALPVKSPGSIPGIPRHS